MTHVLVTRPSEASQQLASMLAAHGLDPVAMPLYAFSAREPGARVLAALSEPAGRTLAVFTSPRAVQYGLPHLPPAPSGRAEVAVVGSATRAMLEAAGRQVDHQAATGFTSEDLLALPALATSPGTAVIFCAPGGRDALANGLRGMGWKVLAAMVYERVPLPADPCLVAALEAAEDLISVWTSVSALELAAGQLPAALWERILAEPALVVSARLQRYLRKLGARRVEVADGPGNADLLKSILRMAARRPRS